MSYNLLGHDLYEVADRAKEWFVETYGAKRFRREKDIASLPLRPTWQASLRGNHTLCLNVQSSPFSPTLHAFVNAASQRGLPIKLWVAVSDTSPKDSFAAELRQAREAGVGVLQISTDGNVHVFHHPVSLSLYGISRTTLGDVPRARREIFKNAEDTFLNGAPDQGCQAICQELEDFTRRAAEVTHSRGWWTQLAGGAALQATFFRTGAWATMLQTMEGRANVTQIQTRCPEFDRQLIIRTRAFTDWRNRVSHRPNTAGQLMHRDGRLRTMFEATRDLLLDWYGATGPLRLLR